MKLATSLMMTIQTEEAMDNWIRWLIFEEKVAWWRQRLSGGIEED